MSRKSQLYRLMSEDLPNLTYQKRLSYRTSEKEVYQLFKIINKEIFNNKLPTPVIEVLPRCRDYWGFCEATEFNPEYQSKKSHCVIRLSDKWFCRQWLITVLAHEMCHQYQWDVETYDRVKCGLEPIMSHGPTFFKFKNKLAKHGISLKKAHAMRAWFDFQNLFKA